MGSQRPGIRYAFAVALCWLPFVAVVWAAIAWWDVVAGDISTQWSGDEVTTTAPAWTALLLPLCGTLICGVLATVASFDADGPGARRVFLFCFGIGAMLAFVWIGVMVPNVLAPDDPPMPDWLLLSPLLILLGFAPWAIAGRGERRDDPAPASEHALPAPVGERVWVGTAWSPLLVLIGGGIGVIVPAVLAIVGFAQQNTAVAIISSSVTVVIVVAVAILGWLTVAVDDGGMRVRSAIGIPLKRIPIAKVRDAQATVLSAAAWGGVGYRVGPEGTALVLRSGLALEVVTDTGRFYVTIDRAADAAAVLREAAARCSGPA